MSAAAHGCRDFCTSKPLVEASLLPLSVLMSSRARPQAHGSAPPPLCGRLPVPAALPQHQPAAIAGAPATCPSVSSRCAQAAAGYGAAPECATHLPTQVHRQEGGRVSAGWGETGLHRDDQIGFIGHVLWMPWTLDHMWRHGWVRTAMPCVHGAREAQGAQGRLRAVSPVTPHLSHRRLPAAAAPPAALRTQRPAWG